MTLTVGTDSYATLAELDAYWLARGNTLWAAATDANREIYAIKATDFIARNYRFRGTREFRAQRLHFPCIEAYDSDGHQFGDVEAPDAVKEAEAIVADVILAGVIDLDGIITGDIAITKQKVDVIEVEYDSTLKLKGAAQLSHVSLLLGPYTTGNDLLRA
jgi:hypothetical protein